MRYQERPTGEAPPSVPEGSVLTVELREAIYKALLPKGTDQSAQNQASRIVTRLQRLPDMISKSPPGPNPENQIHYLSPETIQRILDMDELYPASFRRHFITSEQLAVTKEVLRQLTLVEA